MTQLSVVVPTFNRGDRLLATVHRVLECTARDLEEVEIVVVDDGSAIPAERVLLGLSAPAPFTLRVLRQENAGPARARNTGFRASQGSLVLFMDDDILAGPTLLEDHVRAHRDRPGAVVFGRSPWATPDAPGALFRFLQGLGHDAFARATEALVPVVVPASGHLSVERATFDRKEGVYRDDLETPGAEEFELAARLQSRGVAIYIAPQISAIHDSPVSLRGFCRQQFIHGRGCAEAAMRCPETRALPELLGIVAAAASAPSAVSRMRSALKDALTASLPRAAITWLAELAEDRARQADSLAPLYRLAVGLHFRAGVQDGLARYSSES